MVESLSKLVLHYKVREEALTFPPVRPCKDLAELSVSHPEKALEI